LSPGEEKAILGRSINQKKGASNIETKEKFAGEENPNHPGISGPGSITLSCPARSPLAPRPEKNLLARKKGTLQERREGPRTKNKT